MNRGHFIIGLSAEQRALQSKTEIRIPSGNSALFDAVLGDAVG